MNDVPNQDPNDPFADWQKSFQPPDFQAPDFPSPDQMLPPDGGPTPDQNTPSGPAAPSGQPTSGGGKSNLPPVVAPPPQGPASNVPHVGLPGGPETRSQVQTSNSSFDYAGARDAWMSGKYSKDEAGAAQWARDYGIPYGGGDTITLPNGGGSIDILGNWAGGKGNGQAVTQNWTPAGGNGPNPGGQGGGGSSAGGPSSPYDQEVHDAIMALLKRGQAPVTEADIASQYGPMSQANQRARDQAKAATAQRAAFEGSNQGGQGGSFDAETAKVDEAYAAQEGQLSAKLIGQELQARRADVVNALGFAQGEEKMALQMQLAQIDKELRQASLNLQEKSLGQQNQQFYDQMGYNTGRDEYLFSQLFAQGLGSGG